MKVLKILAVVAAALLTLPATAASPGADLQSVLVPYEELRTALVNDDLEAVQAPAETLQDVIQRLRKAPEKGAASEVPLGELAAAAESLAGATDLEAARDAFHALSKPLVRWRKGAGEGPVVVYCAMKDRSWLQSADDEIGNPYYGQAMARCGEVVAK